MRAPSVVTENTLLIPNVLNLIGLSVESLLPVFNASRWRWPSPGSAILAITSVFVEGPLQPIPRSPQKRYILSKSPCDGVCPRLITLGCSLSLVTPWNEMLPLRFGHLHQPRLTFFFFLFFLIPVCWRPHGQRQRGWRFWRRSRVRRGRLGDVWTGLFYLSKITYEYVDVVSGCNSLNCSEAQHSFIASPSARK